MELFADLRWLKSEFDGEYDNIEGPYISCNLNINKRIYLCTGQVWKLPVDCILIGQNEPLTDRSECAQIFHLAGPRLEDECFLAAPIQTGDSVLCHGYNLCPYIINSVCPKYTEKYITACENSLFSAYRSALFLATTEVKDIKTLAITCINLKTSGYPRDMAAHTALRTVRRFLEHKIGDSIEKIIFCVVEDDFQLYNLLMTAYFPRNEGEVLHQVQLLPENLGDEWGDTASIDRSLKVTQGPRPFPGHEQRLSEGRGSRNSISSIIQEPRVCTWPPPRSMRDITATTDTQRLRRVSEELAAMTREARLQLRFETMARVLEGEDLSDIEEMQFVRFGGQDRSGRTVILITAANFKVPEEEDFEFEIVDRTIMYIMRRMETLNCVPYVIIYACSGLNFDSRPRADRLQEIFDLFHLRYAANFQTLYLLHKSPAMYGSIMHYCPFLVNSFWNDYQIIDNLQALNRYMELESVGLPVLITEYDKRLFP